MTTLEEAEALIRAAIVAAEADGWTIMPFRATVDAVGKRCCPLGALGYKDAPKSGVDFVTVAADNGFSGDWAWSFASGFDGDDHIAKMSPRRQMVEEARSLGEKLRFELYVERVTFGRTTP